MKTTLIFKTIAVASLMLAFSYQEAEAQIAFDMVEVGNANNAPDSHTHPYRNGRGSVAYDYRIGTYEVTNTQYAAFLNAVAKSDTFELYHPYMGDHVDGGIVRTGTDGNFVYQVKEGHENRPVVFVSLSDAMYFSNWLTNGQGTGGIQTGSYDMSIALPDSAARLAPSAPGQVQYFVASENEWYKAAYYDPTLNSGEGGYWDYGTQSNTAPVPSAVTGNGNTGNLNRKVGRSTDVGSYTGSYSFYGGFDFEGNVSEFTDTIRSDGLRWQRRGVSSWSNNLTGASNLGGDPYETHASTIGFRIVAVTAIPEPSTAAILTAAGAGMILAKYALRKKQ